MSEDKFTCSACYEDNIAEGDVEVVILTKNPNGYDFNVGWSGVICHKACANQMNWSAR